MCHRIRFCDIRNGTLIAIAVCDRLIYENLTYDIDIYLKSTRQGLHSPGHFSDTK
jgi:hypothetical protein